LTGQPAWRHAARWGWGLLLTFSVAFNLFASLARQAETDDALGWILLERGRVDEAIPHFQRALEIQPDNAVTHNSLGKVLQQQGRVDEAITHFQRALDIQPDYAIAHNNLGTALLQRGQVDEAITHFQKALESQTHDATAQAAACNNLGNVFFQQGRVNEAIGEFQKAVEILPQFAQAHDNLGNVLFQQGRVDEAIGEFQKAVEILPQFAQAHDNLGNALLQRGRVQEGVLHYQRSLEIQSDAPATQHALAWVLATCPEASIRNGARAVELAQRANQLSGGRNAMILCTLGAAYAECGRFAEAIAAAQQALELATTQNNAALAVVLRGQIGLYQKGSPYRDPRLTKTPARSNQP